MEDMLPGECFAYIPEVQIGLTRRKLVQVDCHVGEIKLEFRNLRAPKSDDVLIIPCPFFVFVPFPSLR